MRVEPFLYPVLVAIIMVFLRVVPSWQVWLAIVATFAGDGMTQGILIAMAAVTFMILSTKR